MHKPFDTRHGLLRPWIAAAVSRAITRPLDMRRILVVVGLVALGFLYLVFRPASADDKEETWSARGDAIGDLDHPTEDTVPVLRAMLADESARVRDQATTAVIKYPAAALPLLRDFLKDDDVKVRRGAVAALRYLGDAAVPVLSQALQDKDWVVRATACRLLGTLGPRARAATPALRALLRDENTVVKEEAADALEKIAPDASRGAADASSSGP
jgi:HEAT repeat protein